VEAAETTKAILTKNQLAFVNRTDAMVELLQVHERNSLRTVRDDGLSPVIPFLDNLQGMGKSSLGANYLSECPKHFDSSGASPELQESLKHARKITVKFPTGKLFNAMNQNSLQCENVIATEFILWIKKSRDITGATNRLEASANEAYKPSVQVIMTFIEETGRPLFLVIDEIGAAFSAKTQLGPDLHRAQVEKDVFLRFCREVVMTWLEIPNLHILLTGRGR